MDFKLNKTMESEIKIAIDNILSLDASVSLIVTLKAFRSQILLNEEIPLSARRNWLDMLDNKGMEHQREVFYTLKKALGSGDDNAKTFATKLINNEALTFNYLQA